LLHIICFNVPFPPTYGGVAEVYYKLLAIKQQQIPFVLHLFTYGRPILPELYELTDKIFVYKRNTGIRSFFSILPYIVKSRVSKELIKNLKADNSPIFCEGLHTAGILLTNFKNRNLMLRMHNNEPAYYHKLAMSEHNIFRKLYFYSEAFKLKLFERNLKKFDTIFTISDLETEYYKSKPELSGKVVKLPVFHANTAVTSVPGKGNYVLFHGNLEVAENYTSAIYLIETVFSRLQKKVLIAGLNPNKKLIQKISHYSNIELIASPSAEAMQVLIANAHCIVLYTMQNTGTKLKLLNSVFAGRFCVANSVINSEMELSGELIIANTSEEIINAVENCFLQNFTENMSKRRSLIFEKNYANSQSIKILIDKL